MHRKTMVMRGLRFSFLRRAASRRAVGVAAAILLAAGYALATGAIPGVGAIFTAETANPNAVAQGGWIPAPSGAASSLDGSPYSQEHLAWVSGHSTPMPSGSNPVTGQTIEYADGGSGSSAGCGSYSAFTTVGATATTADLTGSDLADWWCFQVYSTSAGSWTSGTVTFTPRRLFLPVQTVALANGILNGYAYNGDTIEITFNQAPSNPGTVSVEVCTSGVIRIGSNSCNAAGSIGTISGLSISANGSFTTSTSTVGGSTLTIKLGGSRFVFARVSGTGTFTAGTGATSSGGQHACSAPACSVATSGNL
jgi:hypothetical protein